jgi:hypothetical protein
MVKTVDKDVLTVLEVFYLLTTLGYDFLCVEAIWLIIMHELGSVLDDEVAIVTREVMKDNDSLEVAIVVPYITKTTPSANILICYVVMMYHFNNFSSIFSP